MTREDYNLVVLMEECAEASLEAALARVAQRASKQLRFGADEIQPGQLKKNRERLRDEILDLICCIGFLEESKQIDEITAEDVDKHMKAKRGKIYGMLTLSRAMGRLDPEPPSE